MEFLKPFQLGKLTLKNRIDDSVMGTNFSADGIVTDKLIYYYAERARGGVGLIIIESSIVDVPRGRVIKNQLSIHDDSVIPGLRRLAAAIKAEGARVGIQLAHSGRLASSRATGVQPVAPSPIAAVNGDVPKELTPDEIQHLVRLFAHAARRAKQAGIELVELHGAHGYLLGSFLSPYTNKRTDEYGGDFARRLMFPLEVVHAIKEINGKDYPIIFKLSGDEYVKGGITVSDTIAIVRELARQGVDCIDVSATAQVNQGDGVPKILTNRPYCSFPDGCFVDIAKEIKKAVNIPVMVCGKIYRPEQVEEILKNGYADLIDIGRGQIAEPQWCNKVARNDLNSMRVCLQCNIGCEGKVLNHEEIACTINPYVGREAEQRIISPSTLKKVVVAGGGPAGMEAARTAAALGHRVTLLEKRARLGGLLDVASTLSYKNYGRLSDYLTNEIERLGVEVHLNAEATKESVLALEPDVVVWAVGGDIIVPPIDGISGNLTVSNAVLVLRGESPVGNEVIVIGGGLAGLETAEFLASQGKKVTVLEKMDQAGNDIPPLIRRIILSNLNRLNVEVKTRVDIRSIERNQVHVQAAEKPLSAHTLIVAAGFQPKSLPVGVHIYYQKNVHFYAVGDCARPGRVLDAVRDANKLGAAL